MWPKEANQLHDGQLLAWQKLSVAAAEPKWEPLLPVAHQPARVVFVVDPVLVVVLDAWDEVVVQDAAAALGAVALDVVVVAGDDGGIGTAGLDAAGLDAAAEVERVVELEPVLQPQAEERELVVAVSPPWLQNSFLWVFLLPVALELVEERVPALVVERVPVLEVSWPQNSFPWSCFQNSFPLVFQLPPFAEQAWVLQLERVLQRPAGLELVLVEELRLAVHL